MGFPAGRVVKNPSANAGNARDLGLIPGSGRSLGGGTGNSFQDSCLWNSMDRGAWWSVVNGVAKESDTLRSCTHMCTHPHTPRKPTAGNWEQGKPRCLCGCGPPKGNGNNSSVVHSGIRPPRVSCGSPHGWAEWPGSSALLSHYRASIIGNCFISVGKENLINLTNIFQQQMLLLLLQQQGLFHLGYPCIFQE